MYKYCFSLLLLKYTLLFAYVKTKCMYVLLEQYARNNVIEVRVQLSRPLTMRIRSRFDNSIQFQYYE